MTHNKDGVNEFKAHLREYYSSITRDESEKILEAVQKFFIFAGLMNNTLAPILEEVARTLYRLFEFKEVLIGIRDPKDKMYRYATFVGFRKDTEDKLKQIRYTKEDFFDPNTYPGIWISKQTKYFLSEDEPYDEDEKDTFNRPLILQEPRKSGDEFREGDYIDVHIFGPRDEMIGWIELSNTKNGKIPSRNSIFWLELIASALSVIIQKEELELPGRANVRIGPNKVAPH